jgi:phosphoribosylamine-glycine ligase
MNVLLSAAAGARRDFLALKNPRASIAVLRAWNAGISEIADCVDIKATDINGHRGFSKTIRRFVMSRRTIHCARPVDALEAAGSRLGPRANAAILESSKAFSISLMKNYGFPRRLRHLLDYEARGLYQGKRCADRRDGDVCIGRASSWRRTPARQLESLDIHDEGQ